MNAILSSNRAQGALALFVLMVVLIAGSALFGNAMVDAKWAEAEATTTELDMLRRRIRMPPPAKTDSGDAANAYLAGENYALAVNALQQRVVALIEEAGGKLATVGVDPANSGEQGVSRRAVLQIAAELDNDGLQSLMYQLEAERPLVTVESLNVRRASRTGQSEAEGQESPRLAVDLRVIGYYRRAGS
jgi:hypothetical protein